MVQLLISFCSGFRLLLSRSTLFPCIFVIICVLLLRFCNVKGPTLTEQICVRLKVEVHQN